ncbi:unnamed protein product [Ranitomeya imitator]|uniref:OCRE domain-containing protein n=1 Tax=Ranitomeya imitator TaxID=111125 RepID=A0ABN9M2S0_9NEOB|nr:unnamed protein product [Ranitomeya imitator]
MTYKAIHNLSPPYICDLVSRYLPTRNLRSSQDLLLYSPLISSSHNRIQDFSRVSPSTTTYQTLAYHRNLQKEPEDLPLPTSLQPAYSYEHYTHTDAHEVEASNGSESTIDRSQDPGESTSLCDGGVQESDNCQEESGTSLAESLRATAEAALSQTGFTYDENTGMYYDHSTGFYYDSESQLYYDPATGIYYYCDVENGRYLFIQRWIFSHL